MEAFLWPLGLDVELSQFSRGLQDVHSIEVDTKLRGVLNLLSVPSMGLGAFLAWRFFGRSIPWFGKLVLLYLGSVGGKAAWTFLDRFMGASVRG